MRGKSLIQVLDIAAALLLAGCMGDTNTSARRLETNIAENCRAWEERAKTAAAPDAETIARHDRLIKLAANYGDEALANYKDVVARQRAIERQVQARADADAIYDWRTDLKYASDCWDELASVSEIHEEQRRHLGELAQSLARQHQATASSDQNPVSRPNYAAGMVAPTMQRSTPYPSLQGMYEPRSVAAPSNPAFPGPYLGHIDGGPDVYGAFPPAPAPDPTLGPMGPPPQPLGGN